VLAFVGTALCAAPAAQAPPDAVPQTVDEFQAAAVRVLADTGVPGAGLALVRAGGVEWEGGVGFADRDRRLPVTANTQFRVGSISKTFVAIALMQLAEDGLLDIDAPVREIVPDVEIENAWEASDPVRVIHLLQHTAGFDDMHFNEMYVPDGEAERPLGAVLRINPSSRRVRWQPGTRMAYSNPGYAVAGLVLETAAAMEFEDYIAHEIFAPLEMHDSSFRPADAGRDQMARGYSDDDGPPLPLRGIYLRPAGAMLSSPHDMARFVQMLLGWGELGAAFVIDPEFLGNMEYPRTTLAARAGLRDGYGSGIASRLDLPYKMLGHDGGIQGFVSSYGYSPARDVGYVVLLNSTGPRAMEAMRRLSTMAVSYLKRDVEPPPRPQVSVPAEILDRYAGYYHDANPRGQFLWPARWLLNGRSVFREGDTLYVQQLLGRRVPLVPVTESSFRFDNDLDASRVFVPDNEGALVLTGPQLYSVRLPRWRVEVIRIPLLISFVLLASVAVVGVVWAARITRGRPRGFWELKIALLLCPLAVLLPALALWIIPASQWGTPNAATITVFVATLFIPTLAVVVALFTLGAARQMASRWLTTYAACVALAMAAISFYLSSHDLLGIRLWTY
jgi:CubicO group peptidase (beta-lactamase class C family)